MRRIPHFCIQCASFPVQYAHQIYTFAGNTEHHQHQQKQYGGEVTQCKYMHAAIFDGKGL